MTPSPHLSSDPTAAQKSVNTATKVLNLVSAGLTMLHEPVKVPKKAPPPELYLGDSSNALRLDDDISAFTDQTELTVRLKQLPEKEIDLVFAGRTALDMSFQIPNGPFNDLEAMIETELDFRSPFQREQCRWFWTAQESPNGDWLVEGAIVLKTSIDWVLDAMKATGKTINMARRHREDGALRVSVEPDWLKTPSRLAKATGVFGRLDRIPPQLRMPIAAFVLFAISSVALFVAQSARLNDVSDKAAQARAELGQLAAEQAVIRNLQERRTFGAARLAVIGTLASTLPDGVWLDQVIVDDTELTIIGYAPSAAEVTRLLSGMPALADIEFGSPVTRDNTQNLERFRINATLTGQLL